MASEMMPWLFKGDFFKQSELRKKSIVLGALLQDASTALRLRDAEEKLLEVFCWVYTCALHRSCAL
jgi:hypothetical protein